ncbi:MAG: hydrogenase maturation protease [Candidatus Limnocylindrales bacterium]
MADQIVQLVPAGDGVASGASRPRTIVVGLGNPVLGDDGVGWRIADEVEGRLSALRQAGGDCPAVQIERLGVGGLRLMEFLDGYDVAIVIDAAEFPDRPLGEVRSCALEELDCRAAGHLDSAHDASLVTALALGRRFGVSLPASIQTVTVQVHSTDVFSEQLTPAVQAAVPAAASAVVALLMDAGR